MNDCIQAMLGHVKLYTTQLYAEVSIRTLKEIHTAIHPEEICRAEKSAVAMTGEED